MNWRGPLLMTAQQFCFAVDTAAIHGLGNSLSLWQLSLLRAGGGLILVACLLPSVGIDRLRTKQFGLLGLRGLSSVGYSFVMMFAFANLPLTDASALSYAIAWYVPLLAYYILGERFRPHYCAAIGLGFVGVLLISPPTGSISWVYLAVALGTSLNSLNLVLNRYLQERDHPIAVMFYTNAIYTVAFTPAVAEVWPSDWTSLAKMLLIVVIGPVGTYAGIYAVRFAEVSSLAPYVYTRLLMIAAIAPLMFGEALTLQVVVGSLVIVAACVIATMRGR